MIFPPYLKKGDKIGIVATARKISPEEIKTCIEVIKSWGLQVIEGKNLYHSFNQFAGTDKERLESIQLFLDDPEIKAIICARGGYGTTRIIDLINFTKFLDSPKWICGYSDITALHNHLNNMGFATLHCSMPLLFNRDSSESINSIGRVLFGENHKIEAAANSFNRLGEATGQIVGGNLTMLINTLGTRSELDTREKILFIEDIDEYLYHIDRMMVQLKRLGKLKNLRGLIVGHFHDMKDNKIPFGQNAEEIIREHIKEYSFPVSFNFPVGHREENIAIPVGSTCKFKVSQEGVLLDFSTGVAS